MRSHIEQPWITPKDPNILWKWWIKKNLGASKFEKVCQQTHITQSKALWGDWLILPEASTNQSFSQWLTAGTLKAIRMSWAAKNSRVCPCIHRLGTEPHFEVTCINVSFTLVAKSSVFESRVHLDTCDTITLHSSWGLSPWESLDESLPMWCLSSEWSDAVLFVQFCEIPLYIYALCGKTISWYIYVNAYEHIL